MLILGFKYQLPITNLRESILTAFQVLGQQVLSACPNPQGLGPDLDSDIGWEQRVKVRDAANKMVGFAKYALDYEKNKDHKEAIDWWKFIFSEFPAYGS